MTWIQRKFNQNDLQWFEENIEPPILALTIKLNSLPFIRTTWTCGGHSSFKNLYHNDIKFLIDENNKDAYQFIKKLNNLLKDKFQFASLYCLPGKINNHPEYRLQIESIPYPQEWIKNQPSDIVKKIEKLFNKTYKKMYIAIENLIDVWIKNES